MASAWGTSWGAAWGNAWGMLEQDQPPGTDAPPASPFGAQRRRSRARRLLRPTTPLQAITIDQDDEELALQLLGML
jgi:hypothetical protein